jgi:hypothetical protein
MINNPVALVVINYHGLVARNRGGYRGVETENTNSGGMDRRRSRRDLGERWRFTQRQN